MCTCNETFCGNYNVQTFDLTDPGGEFSNDGNINSILVENVGGVLAVFEDKELLPPPGAGAAGQSFSIGGNAGEIYKGRLRWRFVSAGNTRLQLSIKYYIEK